jgi:hypothetical protein
MQIRGSLSRRWRFALCAVLALGLVAAPATMGAAGKPLPDGTSFHKAFGEGRSLSVGVGGDGLSVTLAGVPVRCTKPGSLKGEEVRVGIGLAAPQHPKVGEFFTLTKTKKQSGGKGGRSTATTEVSLRFNSGKAVLVEVHQMTTLGGKPACEGSASYTVPRQS